MHMREPGPLLGSNAVIRVRDRHVVCRTSEFRLMTPRRVKPDTNISFAGGHFLEEDHFRGQ